MRQSLADLNALTTELNSVYLCNTDAYAPYPLFIQQYSAILDYFQAYTLYT